tara:strand:+ start:2289 stop:2726 length:438 start_codon:yes stop_codon:yes gene_type:complete
MEYKGHKNLIPNTQRSANEVRKNQQKGGINSGQTRRKKKQRKLILKDILELKLNEKVASKIAKAYGVDAKDISLEAAMDFMQVNKAIESKDTQAYNAVKDRVYGKPKQEIQQSIDVASSPTTKSISEVEALLGDIAKTDNTESQS